jgi:hypothetical protein
MHDHERWTIALGAGGTVAGGIGAYKLAGSLIRGMLGRGAATGAAAGGSILSRGLLGGVVGALGPGGLAAAGILGSTTGLNAGEDERARLRRYHYAGLGRGQRELMARAGYGDGFHPVSGSFVDIAQNYRGEESTYKAVLRGAREGVIEAFQWLKRDRDREGAGGGIISAAYYPGGGLGGGVAGAGGGG